MNHQIPFTALRPHLEKYLMEMTPGTPDGLERDKPYDPYGPEVIFLAARADVHPDTLSKALAGKRNSLSFRIADRVICAMGAPQIWRDDPALYEVYYPVAPPPDPSRPIKCANEACSAWFELANDTTAKRRFCSESCKNADYRYRHGKAQPRALRCRNGHNRDPENDYTRADGTTTCRTCLRERDAERRKRRREQAATYMRGYRARQKQEAVTA